MLANGIYFGDRGDEFKAFLKRVLKEKGGLSKEYRDVLLTDESVVLYGDAFTSQDVDELNNYQWSEQYGDLTGNKFIVSYMYERFPQLKCEAGVKVAARLRINYGSKQTFSSIAENLGFWPFITATNEVRSREKKPLLEDAFEAFLGVTEQVIDGAFGIGSGYAAVYTMLKSIFDEMPISLKYEDLYDAKTRLKELFDMFGEKLGPLVYEENKGEGTVVSRVYRYDGARFQTNPDGTVNMNKYSGPYRSILLGEGKACLKADAQQLAASEALKVLASQGFIKHPPAIYARFANNLPEEPVNIQKWIGNDAAKINEQFPTRGKSKYQAKYTSTVLALCCRKRDMAGIDSCLALGASPNIPDSNGSTCMDLVVIGRFDEGFITKAYRKFAKALKPLGQRVQVHKDVLQTYELELEGAEIL